MEEILKSQYWSFDPGYFNSLESIVVKAIESGRDLSFLKPKHNIKSIETPTAIISASVSGSFDRDLGLFVYENSETGKRVAEIGMVGGVTKNGGLCSPGALDLAGQIARADANPKIDGSVLFVDGPGGAISGLTRLAQSISNTQKPLVAFVEEMAASAHLFAIGGADYIVANIDEYVEVGSLGVQSMIMSVTDQLEKEGIKVKILRADQSVDKNAVNAIEPWPEAELQRMTDEMTGIAAEWIDRFKAGRGERLQTGDENVFTGKMYTADQALQMGMIDFKGDLAGAINLVSDLSEARKKMNN